MQKEILLIHGWDPRVYNNNLNSHPADDVAWKHRYKMIRLLSKNYTLSYFNLPGFCGVQEPAKESFNVENFTSCLAEHINKLKKQPSAILGYSFGGVVALDYKARYNKSIPTILISPAIRRAESSKSSLAHIAKNLYPWAPPALFVKAYQYIFSKYYRTGTPFLRKSYNLIARRDTTSKLRAADKKSMLLIYGDKDTATPLQLVEKDIRRQGLQHVILKEGGHNIGQTHAAEISRRITKFLDDK